MAKEIHIWVTSGRNLERKLKPMIEDLYGTVGKVGYNKKEKWHYLQGVFEDRFWADSFGAELLSSDIPIIAISTA